MSTTTGVAEEVVAAAGPVRRGIAHSVAMRADGLERVWSGDLRTYGRFRTTVLPGPYRGP